MTNEEQQLISTLLAAFSAEAGTPLTEDDVSKKLDALIPILCRSLTKEGRDRVLKTVLEIIPISQPPGAVISNENDYTQSNKTWYTDKKNTDGFSKRSLAYFGCLKKKLWSPKVIQTIDFDTDEIMNLLGNPASPSFDIRGLIMGDVQSGKTSNFIALCNKAADAGYRVIIITSGIIEKLRQQTQSRLTSEFVKLLPQAEVPVLTTNDSDFDANAGRVSKQTPLQVFRPDVPVLFVIKKNAKVLRRVLKWLKTAGSGKLDAPLLLIDDEADNASINTGNPDSDSPTTINKLLRELLNRFEKSSYVGITATPFANVFINPDIGGDDIDKQDLFPKSFVYRIEPASSYLTSERLFQNGSPFLRDIDDLETWLPATHNKDARIPHDGMKMPFSMRYAITLFIIRNYLCQCGAIGDSAPIHRSMLIHISRFISVQNKIAFAVEHFVKTILARAVALYGNDPAKTATSAPLAFIKSVWDAENIGKTYNVDWNATVSDPRFCKGIHALQIVCVNSGKAAGKLDYEAHEKSGGLQVIAIGGNALARGLTLEGLIISYFRRNTKMADTLMQMSRWLGHRASYEDLVSVWLEPEARTYFEYAMTISEELAMMFHQMHSQHCSPTQFAIKVRRYPGSFLPTARNKMKTATDAHFPYDLAGYALETPRMPNDAKLLAQNEKTVKSFMVSIQGNESRDPERKNTLYFRDIPPKKIAGFLHDFKSHAMNYGFEIQQVADCISEMDTSELWDVALLHVDEKQTPDNINVGTDTNPIFLRSAKRQLALERGRETIQISGTKLKVSPGSVMQYGLPKHESEAVLAEYRATHGPDGKPRASTAEAPDIKYLEKMKKSLLVIQHIVKSNAPSKLANSQVPVQPCNPERDSFFALSLGFRGARKGPATMNYHMTKTAMEFFKASLDDEGGDQ